MSDSEGDFSDELLELAGATEKKRKCRQAGPSMAKTSASKRRRADVTRDLDNEPESEEEDEQTSPYPLEGKYTDEADRQRLLELSEIEREDILAQRLEEMQKLQDKRNLDQMLKAQRNGIESDNVAKAAKRQHMGRGATKEKSRKLDELKAKRKAKDERKRTKHSPKREHSSSPIDMEMSSSEEEEEGMISKQEQEEERDRKLFDKSHPEEDPITMDDLNKCRITRDQLAKHCMAPWFEDYVKGSWVRYLLGMEKGEPVYRICEIQNLSADLIKPYKINDQTVNQQFELKHGKSTKDFPMDKTSNSPFHRREFDRLVKVYEADKVKLPTKRQLEKKAEQLAKLPAQPMTEADINAMLARKNLLNNNRQTGPSLTMERSRLTQKRTLAMRRQDYKEVAEIDKELKELAATVDLRPRQREEEPRDDILAKVNERNRKANLESVRKAELAESERKRRDRKLAVAAHKSRTSTPVLDLSGKLKTASAFKSASSQGTSSVNGTPSLQPEAASRDVSPLPPSALSGQIQTPGTKSKSFSASVLEDLEIDLGDF